MTTNMTTKQTLQNYINYCQEQLGSLEHLLGHIFTEESELEVVKTNLMAINLLLEHEHKKIARFEE